MQKVWILEVYETREACEEILNQLKKGVEHFAPIDKSAAEIYEKSFNNLTKILEDNPDGYWHGFEGKCNYKEFCYVAKQAIKRQPNFKFRVVEAEIADDAKYWVNYKITKVNEGVYRYLMATV